MSFDRDEEFMNSAPVQRPIINIGILEDDPLRLVGFQSILDQVPDFLVTAMSMADIALAGRGFCGNPNC
jgi:hypothetical protein